MLLVPDSVARLVLEELDSTAPLTPSQLIARTGRSKAAICKTLRFLVSEGYVRQSGAQPNRLGRFNGRATHGFSRTAKTLPEQDPGGSTACDLWTAVDALVRSALAAQCGQSVSA